MKMKGKKQLKTKYNGVFGTTTMTKSMLLAVVIFSFSLLFVSGDLLAQQKDKKDKDKNKKTEQKASSAKKDNAGKILDLTKSKDDFWNPPERRDPFSSPIVKVKSVEGRDMKVKAKTGKRPPGIAGMELREVDLVGVILIKGVYNAMVVGTDDMPYLLKIGDELWNAKVAEIDMNCVTFEVEMEDKFLVTQLRKVPRCLDDAEQ